MKKISLFVGMLLVASLLTACAEFDGSYRYQYDNGGGGHSGHSHH